ncbi:MAG: nucleotidyl transferase AbiEii/AbiGii toxin family protein [Planctomycetes bacterium]|nr:nucleotidyl transferase AbiEii/AbiGii toxin family protein [Planctomycetota bacterium]
MVAKSFRTPAAFKASLEERLRSRARAGEGDLQRLRQLVVYDRFLARLFAEERPDVVLKGGLVLELRSRRARATKDVDLRMAGNPAATLDWLQAVGRKDRGDFLHFEITVDPVHPTIDAAGLAYQGRRYRAQALLAGKPYGRPFGLDVAFAEPLVGEPEVLEGEPWLDFLGIPPTRARVCPLLVHVAEKLHAYSLPRTRPNSRVKDLPDLALLARVRSIDAGELRAAITATFAHRATHAVPAVLPEPPASWVNAYAVMAREHDLPWPSLQGLTAAVRAFLDPLLAGNAGRWDPGAFAWRAP